MHVVFWHLGMFFLMCALHYEHILIHFVHRQDHVFYNDLHRPFIGVVERKDHRRFQLEEITPELEKHLFYLLYFANEFSPRAFPIGYFSEDCCKYYFEVVDPEKKRENVFQKVYCKIKDKFSF